VSLWLAAPKLFRQN